MVRQAPLPPACHAWPLAHPRPGTQALKRCGGRIWVIAGSRSHCELPVRRVTDGSSEEEHSAAAHHDSANAQSAAAGAHLEREADVARVLAQPPDLGVARAAQQRAAHHARLQQRGRLVLMDVLQRVQANLERGGSRQ